MSAVGEHEKWCDWFTPGGHCDCGESNKALLSKRRFENTAAQADKKPGVANGDLCPKCGEFQMPPWSKFSLHFHDGRIYSENARCCQNCSFIEEKYPKAV